LNATRLIPGSKSDEEKTMRSLVNNCALPMRSHTTKHKVPIYLEYHSVCPLVGIVTPPTLSPASECASPWNRKGGGAHSPACEGMGESQSGRLERKLRTLSTRSTKATNIVQNHNKTARRFGNGRVVGELQLPPQPPPP
jgi:hypothetical protein